jgi:hypothetical protein
LLPHDALRHYSQPLVAVRFNYANYSGFPEKWDILTFSGQNKC